MRASVRALHCAALLMLLAACGGGGGAAPGGGLPSEPPTVLGGTRPASVVLPADYDPTAQDYPLVVLLHGYGASASVQDLLFRLTPRAEAGEMILVLPEGTRDLASNRFWNAGDCCNFGGSAVDDVGYLAGLIEEALSVYAVRPGRIALVGHSNGGYMAYRMACERPDLVRRIVVLAGSTPVDANDCTSNVPVGVLHLHGTLDAVIPYGGSIGVGVPGVGAEGSVERWAQKAGCGPWQQLADADALSLQPGNETEVFRYGGCGADTVVELWRLNGGDHGVVDATATFREAVARFATWRRP